MSHKHDWSEGEYNYWSIEVYELTGMISGEGYSAVYAHKKGDGTHFLLTYPLAFFAIAEVETRTYRRRRDEKGICSEAVSVEKEPNWIVGIEVSQGGSFDICEDCDNFSGYVRTGEDPKDTTDYLDSKIATEIENQKTKENKLCPS